jgi:hypothetical protein
MGNAVKFGMIGIAALAASPAHATMPPNPERLLKVKTCAEAKQNLIKAKAGSPLISPAKNAKIVKELEQAVKRLCSK